MSCYHSIKNVIKTLGRSYKPEVAGSIPGPPTMRFAERQNEFGVMGY